MSKNLSAEAKRVLFLLRARQICYGFCWGVLSFFVIFLSGTGMDPQTVGLVMTLNSIAGIVSPPFWGMIGDKLGSRKMLLFWLLIIAGLLVTFVPPSATINVFGVSLVVFVLPLSTFFRQPTSAMMDAMIVGAAEQFEGMSYSNIRVFSSISFLIINPLYPVLNGKFGVAFAFYSFLVFAWATAFFNLKLKDYRSHGEAVAHHKGQPKQKLHLSRIFKDYYLVTFLIFIFIAWMPSQAYFFLNYLLEDVGGDANIMGILVAIKTCGEVLMLSCSNRMKKYLSLPQLIVLGASLYGLEQLLYPLCTATWQVTIVNLLDGMGFGTFLGSAVNYVYSLAPKGLETTATTLYGAGMGIGGIIASSFGGWAIAAHGIKWMYGVNGIIMVVIIALFLLSFWFGKKVLKKEPPIPFRLNKQKA